MSLVGAKSMVTQGNLADLNLPCPGTGESIGQSLHVNCLPENAVNTFYICVLDFSEMIRTSLNRYILIYMQ